MILYEERTTRVEDAHEAGDRLWLQPEKLEAATGWTLKPEGLCRGDACVPLPRDGSWLDEDGRVDLTAFAERFDRPAVRDRERAIWAFGDSAASRRQSAESGRAPDFTLPDVDGNEHSLSDFRGKKIFLLAWGSY